MGFGRDPAATTPEYMLLDLGCVMISTGVACWAYRGRSLGRVVSDRDAETEASESLPPLQLDAFNSLWSLHQPSGERARLSSPVTGSRGHVETPPPKQVEIPQVRSD